MCVCVTIRVLEVYQNWSFERCHILSFRVFFFTILFFFIFINLSLNTIWNFVFFSHYLSLGVFDFSHYLSYLLVSSPFEISCFVTILVFEFSKKNIIYFFLSVKNCVLSQVVFDHNLCFIQISVSSQISQSLMINQPFNQHTDQQTNN